MGAGYKNVIHVARKACPTRMKQSIHSKLDSPHITTIQLIILLQHSSLGRELLLQEIELFSLNHMTLIDLKPFAQN